jgi:uncharacterized protein (DUF433 family)
MPAGLQGIVDSESDEAGMRTDELLQRIDINPQVMSGKPVIRGTRITVEILLEQIAAGSLTDEVVAEYPQLSREDVLAAVASARESCAWRGSA